MSGESSRLGTVKWKHVPFFQVPPGKWKIGAIWDLAYYETAEYVIQGVLERRLFPGVHGVVGVFLFRHFVEPELKYILFHSRWLKDNQTNMKEDIEAIARIHNLDRLWADVKAETPPKFGDTWKTFDIAFIDEVVKELTAVDPVSYSATTVRCSASASTRPSPSSTSITTPSSRR